MYTPYDQLLFLPPPSFHSFHPQNNHNNNFRGLVVPQKFWRTQMLHNSCITIPLTKRFLILYRFKATFEPSFFLHSFLTINVVTVLVTTVTFVYCDYDDNILYSRMLHRIPGIDCDDKYNVLSTSAKSAAMSVQCAYQQWLTVTSFHKFSFRQLP